MTTEMFLGGLMILTLVAGIVIAMTSTRNNTDRRFDSDFRSVPDHKARNQSKR